MEATYIIDKEKRMIFTTVKGEISIEDLLAFENKLINDPVFEAGFDSLVDFSKAHPPHDIDIKKINMSIEYIASIQEKRGKCKWAIYAPHDYVYTFWLIFEGLSEKLDIKVKVFEDEEEARKWLGI